MDRKNPKIVIIGAGIAGISAAKTLLENGMKNVKIFEASNRVGGRIHTMDFGRVFTFFLLRGFGLGFIMLRRENFYVTCDLKFLLEQCDFIRRTYVTQKCSRNVELNLPVLFDRMVCL